MTQPVESGASTVNENANLSKAERDWKKDMLRYKDEAAALKEQLQEIQLEKEQKKGNLEGVITQLKEELKETKKLRDQDRYSFASSQLDNALKEELLSRGLSAEKKGKDSVSQVELFIKLIYNKYKYLVEFV